VLVACVAICALGFKPVPSVAPAPYPVHGEARGAPVGPKFSSIVCRAVTRGPRPWEPGSPSAIAGSALATTSPSINRPAQAVLGCVANTLVRVDQASHLGHS